MIIKAELKNLTSDAKAEIVCEEESICPLCKHAISPLCVVSTLNTSETASILNYCFACKNVFITNYYVKEKSSSTNIYKRYDGFLISSIPSNFTEENFDNEITSLSPQFVKIYNQALAAESHNLDEISGVGFRKSLEFLVKDFAIHEFKENEEEIKNLPLAKCIDKYIENKQIATLAERSAWIGNDETHYVRKQADRDVSDMKSFIKAMVYFIGMVLITEDASTIEPK